LPDRKPCRSLPVCLNFPELKAKGEQAETDFRDWLNWSGVGYMYVEKSPLNVPERLRDRIKRPDYLAGIPHAGILAFDVKAKSVYDGDFIFDWEEIEKLARFARLFNLTGYFACLDRERPDQLPRSLWKLSSFRMSKPYRPIPSTWRQLRRWGINYRLPDNALV
jgi:Holliday junction resolvase